MSTQEQAPATKGALKKKNRTQQPAPATAKAELKPVTVRVDTEVLSRAQAAYRLLYGMSLQQTFSEFVQEALAREAKRIEEEHNGGQPLKPGAVGLTRGRKV